MLQATHLPTWKGIFPHALSLIFSKMGPVIHHSSMYFYPFSGVLE